MIDKIGPIAQLLKHLQQVPYLASKNLYRVANYFLALDADKMEQFCKALQAIKQQLDTCSLCCSWKEKNAPCAFCSSPKRNQSLICVVENWQDMIAIEKSGGYQGLYHILGGVICPLDGIGPENLSIELLKNRMSAGSFCSEVILALNQTPEGEATSAYIANRLKDTNVIVSCLARGVPVGASLESIDRLTVYKALTERRPF